MIWSVLKPQFFLFFKKYKYTLIHLEQKKLNKLFPNKYQHNKDI